MKKKRVVGIKAVRKGYCNPNCKRMLRSKIKEARLTDGRDERLVKLREAQTLALQYTEQGLLSAEKCTKLLIEIGQLR